MFDWPVVKAALHNSAVSFDWPLVIAVAFRHKVRLASGESCVVAFSRKV